MQINRDNLKWAGRMALILLLVAAADCLIVQFVRKPMPWVALLTMLIPTLTVFFIILPMNKVNKTSPPTSG